MSKCPFKAVQIINLPKNLSNQTTHRYGANSFKLHRLPTPRTGQVLGLVGTNGIGKSTALKILAGKLKPNLGDFDDPPDWEDILRYFRGSELQTYFTRILEDDIKCVVKPQYVDHIPKAVKGTVAAVLDAKREREGSEELTVTLELEEVGDRPIKKLSGGELQRFAICVVAIQEADVYMFDEPSSYLDVKQRLTASQVIRSLVDENTYVIVVEHDLAILDYLSDFVVMLYGKPGAYGVCTMPYSVREGINVFLAGYIPTENMRFRPHALNFKVAEQVEDDEFDDTRHRRYSYPHMTKVLTDEDTGSTFTLNVEEGQFTDSEVIVLLGENGTGKTTFIRLMAGLLPPDEDSEPVPELNVSYKPQKISPRFKGTVRQLLGKKIRAAVMNPQFNAEIIKPLMVEELMDQKVLNLSGGELQRVALTLCLGAPADVYLIDEPSAYLDAEQRVHVARVLKRYVIHAKKTAFIVEHDFIMATYMADRVIVYTGTPAVEATANSPQTLLSGMNAFLENLNVTLRRDDESGRPRVNKLDSVKDQEQKRAGMYFVSDDA